MVGYSPRSMKCSEAQMLPIRTTANRTLVVGTIVVLRVVAIESKRFLAAHRVISATRRLIAVNANSRSCVSAMTPIVVNAPGLIPDWERRCPRARRPGRLARIMENTRKEENHRAAFMWGFGVAFFILGARAVSCCYGVFLIACGVVHVVL